MNRHFAIMMPLACFLFLFNSLSVQAKGKNKKERPQGPTQVIPAQEPTQVNPTQETSEEAAKRIQLELEKQEQQRRAELVAEAKAYNPNTFIFSTGKLKYAQDGKKQIALFDNKEEQNNFFAVLESKGYRARYTSTMIYDREIYDGLRADLQAKISCQKLDNSNSKMVLRDCQMSLQVKNRSKEVLFSYGPTPTADSDQMELIKEQYMDMWENILPSYEEAILYN